VIIAKTIAGQAFSDSGNPWNTGLIVGASALFAVLGHMFSVFLKGHGGKGVATAMGAFLALSPWAVLAIAALYIVIYLLCHYTSVASISSAALFPFVAA